MRTHSGLKEFECEECKKKYTTVYNLKIHKRIHTGIHIFIVFNNEMELCKF